MFWGRLISPFTALARTSNLSIVFLDQSRKSDNTYGGSAAKAGSVDLLAELHPKDGGLACTPRGRVPLAPFRVDLDESGVPVFSTDGHGMAKPARSNTVTQRHRMAVLAALASAEPEGLTASVWLSLVSEREGFGRSTFYEIRKALYESGLLLYASKKYSVSPAGHRALCEESAA